MFKYNLNDLVHYQKSGKYHSARILSRMCVENVHDNWSTTAAQRAAFQKFGRARIVYATIHGEFSEPELFPTAEEYFRFRLKYGSE